MPLVATWPKSSRLKLFSRSTGVGCSSSRWTPRLDRTLACCHLFLLTFRFRLGRTWPLSLIASPDDAAICENTKEGADPLEETSTFSLSVGRGDGRVVFGLCGRQTFVNVSLLLNALRKADLTAAMSPTSRRRADLPPASATASSVDLGDVTLTSFAAGAVGLAESAVLFADWMPVWVYGTDELVSSALVVVAADGVHAFSVAAAVKNGEKPEATLVAFSPFSLVKSILVGLFHQLLRYVFI